MSQVMGNLYFLQVAIFCLQQYAKVSHFYSLGSDENAIIGSTFKVPLPLYASVVPSNRFVEDNADPRPAPRNLRNLSYEGNPTAARVFRADLTSFMKTYTYMRYDST